MLTCEQINRAEHLPRRVAVAGRITSGGRDLLRAPRSGAECVWYQMEYADSHDGSEQLNRSVAFHPGAELVAITDGTGTVYLTPQLARTKLTGPAIATMTASGRDGDVGWQEVIIRPDVPVFVVGRPSRSGQLGPLMTIIKEKGPWRLPELGFPMPTGHRRRRTGSRWTASGFRPAVSPPCPLLRSVAVMPFDSPAPSRGCSFCPRWVLP